METRSWAMPPLPEPQPVLDRQARLSRRPPATAAQAATVACVVRFQPGGTWCRVSPHQAQQARAFGYDVRPDLGAP